MKLVKIKDFQQTIIKVRKVITIQEITSIDIQTTRTITPMVITSPTNTNIRTTGRQRHNVATLIMIMIIIVILVNNIITSMVTNTITITLKMAVIDPITITKVTTIIIITINISKDNLAIS